MPTTRIDFTPSEGHTVGAFPVGFTRHLGTSQTVRVVALGSATDGHALEISGGSIEDTLIAHTASGSTSGPAVIRGRFMVTSSSTGARGLAFVGGVLDAGATAGWTGLFLRVTSQFGLVRQSGAGSTNIFTNLAGTLVTSAWYLFELEITSVAGEVRVRVWRDDGSAPPAWSSSVAGNNSQAGLIGIYAQATSGIKYWDWIEIATLDNERPGAPTMGHSSVAATTATITRTAGTDPEGDPITATRLQVSTSNAFGTTVYDSGVSGEAPFASKGITGLTAETTYYYRAADYDAGGAGDWSTTGTFTTTAATAAPTVSIDQPGPLTLEVGATLQITATATGSPAPDLAWTSSDDAIATVSATGLVTAVAEGVVLITVTATNASGSDFDTVELTVEPAEEVREFAPMWDDVRPLWTNEQKSVPWTSGEISNPHASAESRTRGGFHDPALLALIEAGSGTSFRARAEVLIGATGRWVGVSFYYGQRSHLGGVGLAGYGFGRVGEAPTWWGFYAGIADPNAGLHTTATSVKGKGPASLKVGMLDYRDPSLYGQPSPKGNAGREFASLQLPGVHVWSDTAAAYYQRGLDGETWRDGTTSMTRCPTQGCGASILPVEQWYEVELEVSVAATPGYVRVRARINGADGTNIPLPTLGGWHIDRTIGQPLAGPVTSSWPVGPITLDCAWAGYAARSKYDVEPYQGGYILGRGLEVEVLEGAETCNPQPPEPLQIAPDPPEVEEYPDPAIPDEEWIVFEDDDVTPYYVASALYPYTVNPMLVLGEPLGESSIDLVEGRSVIGQINVRVLDKRTVPADQQTGHLTNALQREGATSHIGRRGLRRRWIEDWSKPRGGYMHVLLDGVVGGVHLEPDHVTFSHPTRDIRERERKIRAFASGFGSSVIPPGVPSGFGVRDGSYLIDPTPHIVGEYETYGFLDFRALWPGQSPTGTPPDTLALTDRMREASRPTSIEYLGDVPVWDADLNANVDTPQYRNTYGNIRWRYRVVGATEWRQTGTPEYTFETTGSPDRTLYELTGPHNDVGVFRTVTGALFLDANGDELPHETMVQVYLDYTGPPSEDWPLYIEGITAGELLARLYDGYYSNPEGFRPVKYDTDAVLALTEPVLARLTESVDDLRQWTEDNVYKPLGYAPAIRFFDEHEGRIFPVRMDPIEPEADLPVLDGSAVIPDGSEWSQQDTSAVNIVRMTWPRFFVPTDENIERGADGIAVRLVTREHVAGDSVALIGEAAWEVGGESAPAIFGAIGGTAGQAISFEAGQRLIDERKDLFWAVRKFGSQRWVLPCHWSATKDLQVGDEVRVRVPWWPNYGTGRRGLDAAGVVVAIADPDYGKRIVTVEPAPEP